MIYQWLIEKVTVSEGNIVTHVHWRCNGIDAANIVFFAGIRELVLGDTFIPYNELTEQQVLDWCFAPETIILEDQTTTIKYLKDDVEAQIVEQISNQATQKAAEPVLPWAN